MQVQIGVGPQGEEVIVVIRRRGRGDGDLRSHSFAGGEQRSGPAQRLDRLVIGGGGAHGLDDRRLGIIAHDRDLHPVEPGWRRPGTGGPDDGNPTGQRRQQGAPARGKLGDADDLDRPQHGGRVIEPVTGDRNEIAGPHHAGRQSREHSGLEAGDGVEAGMFSGTASEIDAGVPRLFQRAGGGGDHPRQGLDALEFAEGGDRQDGLNGDA